MDDRLMLRISERAYAFGLQMVEMRTGIGFARRQKYSTLRLPRPKRQRPKTPAWWRARRKRKKQLR